MRTLKQLIADWDAKYPVKVHRRHDINIRPEDEPFAAAKIPKHPDPDTDTWYFTGPEAAASFIKLQGGTIVS